jgi:hypothetical protein
MDKSSKAGQCDRNGGASAVKTKKGTDGKSSTKRITINISDRIYNEANELDSYLNMGYQNVLKTAMAMGLTELYHQVSSHKMTVK